MPENLNAVDHLALAMEQLKLLMKFRKETSFNDYIQNEKDKIYVKTCLEHLSESLSQASNIKQSLKIDYPQINWVYWKKFRNKCAHEWWNFNHLTAWKVVKRKLPRLEKNLGRIIAFERSIERSFRLDNFEKQLKIKGPSYSFEESLRHEGKRKSRRRGKGFGF